MIILWPVDYMFVAVQYLIIISQAVLTIVRMDLLPISIPPLSIKIEKNLITELVVHMLSKGLVTTIYKSIIINKMSLLPSPRTTFHN